MCLLNKRTPEQLFHQAVSREVDNKLKKWGILGKGKGKRKSPKSSAQPSSDAKLVVHGLTNKSSDMEVREDVTVQTTPASPSNNGPTPTQSEGKRSRKPKPAPKANDDVAEHNMDREEGGMAPVATINRERD